MRGAPRALARVLAAADMTIADTEEQAANEGLDSALAARARRADGCATAAAA